MEITASYLTLSGSRHMESTVNGIALRSMAAGKAGFTSIGACAQELLDSHVSLVSIADATIKCPVREIEWYDLGRPDKATELMLFMMADILGANTVNVGVCQTEYPGKGADETISRRLKSFARMAAAHKLTVNVEPVAFSWLWNPERILAVINAANEPNVGFLYDVWQVEYAVKYAGRNFDIPASMVSNVQVSEFDYDVSRYCSDPFTESQDYRLMPGMRSQEILGKLHADGYSGPVAVEAPSRHLRVVGLRQAATEAYNAVSEVL